LLHPLAFAMGRPSVAQIIAGIENRDPPGFGTSAECERFTLDPSAFECLSFTLNQSAYDADLISDAVHCERAEVVSVTEVDSFILSEAIHRDQVEMDLENDPDLACYYEEFMHVKQALATELETNSELLAATFGQYSNHAGKGQKNANSRFSFEIRGAPESLAPATIAEDFTLLQSLPMSSRRHARARPFSDSAKSCFRRMRNCLRSTKTSD